MISNHYPTIYATEYSWIIISLIIIVGALIDNFLISNTLKKTTLSYLDTNNYNSFIFGHLSDIVNPTYQVQKNAGLVFRKFPKH